MKPLCLKTAIILILMAALGSCHSHKQSSSIVDDETDVHTVCREGVRSNIDVFKRYGLTLSIDSPTIAIYDPNLGCMAVMSGNHADIKADAEAETHAETQSTAEASADISANHHAEDEAETGQTAIYDPPDTSWLLWLAAAIAIICISRKKKT